jgi:hypothetical protein
MPTSSLKKGCPLQKALKFAEEHGCPVTQVKRTGELKIYSQRMGKIVLIHGNRKDCPIRLFQFLIQLNRFEIASGIVPDCPRGARPTPTSP